MKRQLTLSQFVTGPTAAEDGPLGAEARIDSQPKRTKMRVNIKYQLNH